MPRYYEDLNQDIGNWGRRNADSLIGDSSAYAGQANAQNYYYSGLADQAFGVGAGGLQGYTPEQQANILGIDPATGGLKGVNPMSQADAAGLQLTPQERAAMQGNPGDVRDVTYANTSQLGTNVQQGNERLYGAADRGAGNIASAAERGGGMIRGSVDPSKIGLDEGLQGRIGSALDSEAGQLGKATEDPGLGLSDKFSQNYDFSDADRAQMETQAGASVGNRRQAQEDELERNAAAQGQTSPMQLAAARGRMERQSGAEADQAMLSARLGSKQAQLNTLQQGEEMRLGSAQDISSRRLQAGEALAGSRIGAAQTAQGQQIGAAEAGQGLNLNANTGAASLDYGAATQGAGLQTGAAQFGAGQTNQATEFATNANQQGGMYADTNYANRAGQVATNRQNIGAGTQQTQYNQGMGVNNAQSGRYTGVANNQQQQQGRYQDYTSGRYAAANQQIQAGMGMRNTATATGGNIALGGAKQAGAAQETPIWKQAVGAGLAFAGGMAGGLAKGGRVRGVDHAMPSKLGLGRREFSYA